MARGVGGRGPANIMRHIKGLNFPATRSDIIEKIKSGPGPDTQDVLSMAERLPEKDYNSPAEIMKAIFRKD